jgi:hypothetical protein
LSQLVYIGLGIVNRRFGQVKEQVFSDEEILMQSYVG